MSEKEKAFIVRLPLSMHTWLKENVKDQTMNDFVVDSIRVHIESMGKTQAPLKHELVEPIIEPITDNVKALLKVREGIMHKEYLDDGGVGYKRDYFIELEQRWLRDLKAQMDMIEYPTTFGAYVVEEYFEPMGNLSDAEKRAMYYEILKITCEGDPGEVVYKNVTRVKVYDTFDKRSQYSVMKVASKLSLNYQETYNKVIPWMIKSGFKIK